MLQSFTALNTMCRKNPGKQTTCRSPKGNEKQIDYILTKRRHLKYSKDAQANDMSHMGSDHICVLATFVINAHKKRMAPTTHTITSKDRFSRKVSVHRPLKKMETKKHPFSKNIIKNSTKRSNQKLQRTFTITMLGKNNWDGHRKIKKDKLRYNRTRQKGSN